MFAEADVDLWFDSKLLNIDASPLVVADFLLAANFCSKW